MSRNVFLLLPAILLLGLTLLIGLGLMGFGPLADYITPNSKSFIAPKPIEGTDTTNDYRYKISRTSWTAAESTTSFYPTFGRLRRYYYTNHTASSATVITSNYTSPGAIDNRLTNATRNGHNNSYFENNTKPNIKKFEDGKTTSNSTETLMPDLKLYNIHNTSTNQSYNNATINIPRRNNYSDSNTAANDNIIITNHDNKTSPFITPGRYNKGADYTNNRSQLFNEVPKSNGSDINHKILTYMQDLNNPNRSFTATDPNKTSPFITPGRYSKGADYINNRSQLFNEVPKSNSSDINHKILTYMQDLNNPDRSYTATDPNKTSPFITPGKYNKGADYTNNRSQLFNEVPKSNGSDINHKILTYMQDLNNPDRS